MPWLACSDVISQLFPLVDLASVTDAMDDDQTFFANDFVNDPVVPLAKFEQSCKVTFQCFGLDRFHVLRQPSNTLDNATGNRLIEPSQGHDWPT